MKAGTNKMRKMEIKSLKEAPEKKNELELLALEK